MVIFPLLLVACLIESASSFLANFRRHSNEITQSSHFHATTSLAMVSSRQLIGQGMQSFRLGKVEESIDYFNEAESVEPSITPYLWQRGLSYYYADHFEAASNQFRVDVKVNPADAEEIVWDIASQLRLQPEKFPVPNQLALPRRDSRRIMSSVYQLFRGEGSEEDLALAGHSGSSADAFYAAFYLGLYNEGRGHNSKASAYMRQALATPYANSSNDYMIACARVHVARRGWDTFK